MYSVHVYMQLMIEIKLMFWCIIFEINIANLSHLKVMRSINSSIIYQNSMQSVHILPWCILREHRGIFMYLLQKSKTNYIYNQLSAYMLLGTCKKTASSFNQDRNNILHVLAEKVYITENTIGKNSMELCH